MSDILTIRDAVDLAAVIGACQHGSKVRWLTESGDVMEGVARSIGNDSGGFLLPDQDVREAYLRISAGMEIFWPMSKVLAMYRERTLVIG